VKVLERPDNLRKLVAANFIRAGGCLGLLAIKKGKNQQGEETNRIEPLKINGLVREPDSGPNGALTYELPLFEKTPRASITLWFDLKTNLPVKRSLVYLHKDEQVRLTEVYKKWTLNTDIPDERFKLPEEKK
jgi:hypothetical protein